MTFTKITEQPSHYAHLDKMTTLELLQAINAEDCTVPHAVARVLPQIARLADIVAGKIGRGGRLFYVGAGTSGRLGVLDASELPPTYGVPPTLVQGIIAGGDTALRSAVENAEDDDRKAWQELEERNINPLDTVCGIAASGTTPYVVGALRDARAHGVATACITSNPGAPVAGHADIAIEVAVGPEVVTGSSRMKSGTAQKLILNMLSTAIMIRLGRVSGSSMVYMQPTNHKLVERGSHILARELDITPEQARPLLLKYGSVAAAVLAIKGDEAEP